MVSKYTNLTLYADDVEVVAITLNTPISVDQEGNATVDNGDGLCGSGIVEYTGRATRAQLTGFGVTPKDLTVGIRCADLIMADLNMKEGTEFKVWMSCQDKL